MNKNHHIEFRGIGMSGILIFCEKCKKIFVVLIQKNYQKCPIERKNEL